MLFPSLPSVHSTVRTFRTTPRRNPEPTDPSGSTTPVVRHVRSLSLQESQRRLLAESEPLPQMLPSVNAHWLDSPVAHGRARSQSSWVIAQPVAQTRSAPSSHYAGRTPVNHTLQSSCARLLSSEPWLFEQSLLGGWEPTRLSNQPKPSHRGLQHLLLHPEANRSVGGLTKFVVFSEV
jgi:hypothetical protein